VFSKDRRSCRKKGKGKNVVAVPKEFRASVGLPVDGVGALKEPF